jgi:hypothetical protein
LAPCFHFRILFSTWALQSNPIKDCALPSRAILYQIHGPVEYWRRTKSRACRRKISSNISTIEGLEASDSTKYKAIDLKFKYSGTTSSSKKTALDQGFRLKLAFQNNYFLPIFVHLRLMA